MKRVYQLQGDLGYIFMLGRENVLFYATGIKEITNRIEDAHRLNNAGRVDNNFKQNLKRDVIQCFIRGFRPELEIRVEEKDTFREVISDSVDIKRRLAANSALEEINILNIQKLTNQFIIVIYFIIVIVIQIVCLICKKSYHTTKKCFHLSEAQETVPNEQEQFLLSQPTKI